MKELSINLEHCSYNIYLNRGILKEIYKYINLDRKVLIISDDNVPSAYIDIIKQQCKDVYTYIAKNGEDSKSLRVYEQINTYLLDNNFTRKDLIIALGGGVIGDLSGFVASTYMRGIDFIQCPTTTLSQIDSSIGGKVAINFNNVKNIIGSFYHPKAVFIDFNTLETLSNRHYNNGLIEAVKAGLIQDRNLFYMFENSNFIDNIEEIIYKSLLVKKHIVEIDEKEKNERKLLNFGHTIGHAIESLTHMHDIYHGEAVGLGMIKIVGDNELRQRIISVLDKLECPTSIDIDIDKAMEIMKKDKKSNGNSISIIQLHCIGNAYIKDISYDELYTLMKG